ncbi:Cell death protease, partial [Ascosphaera atra]
HIEIDHDINANLFFWHFENKHMADKPRTLLWLNGGPGCSSLDGALMEVGPFRLTDDHTLKHLDGAWNDYANILFVDQPVGTGFSYANTDSYDHEMAEIADHMVTFLEKWFKLFPQYEFDDLYIAGESYAGQHIPYIAKAIVDRNDRVKSERAPWDMIRKGSEAAKVVEHQMDACKAALAKPETQNDIDVGGCEAVLNTILSETEKDGMCYNMYDVRFQEPYPSCGSSWPSDLQYLTPYLRRDDVRKALHINPDKKTGWEECSGSVSRELQNRNSKPSVTLLPSLLESGIPILLFSGADDLICNHIGTEDLIANMEWAGSKGFGDAPRYDWLFEGENAGWYQEARNLTYALIYNSSHMVPLDHPRRSVDMANRFMGVDISSITSESFGVVLDGSNKSTTEAGEMEEKQQEKAQQEQRLQELKKEDEGRLRHAVHRAYLNSFLGFITVIGSGACVWGALMFCRRRPFKSNSGSRSNFGLYSRVPEDEGAVSLMRIPKQDPSDEDLEAADVDEAQLQVLHNIPDGMRSHLSLPAQESYPAMGDAGDAGNAKARPMS